VGDVPAPDPPEHRPTASSEKGELVDEVTKEASSADSQGLDEVLDPVEQLLRLAELREQGILTEDEFTAEKRDILRP
jgi:hypothetical protein